MSESPVEQPTPRDPMPGRHFAFGWLGLAVFALVGLCLEALHGFKSSWYLDVGNETRHLLLRLGHAHGTLFSIVHIAFAVTIAARPHLPRRNLASACLTGAWILIPGGFLLGGAFPMGGDPGLGIFAVPVGALLAITGMAVTGLGIRSGSPDPSR